MDANVKEKLLGEISHIFNDLLYPITLHLPDEAVKVDSIICVEHIVKGQYTDDDGDIHRTLGQTWKAKFGEEDWVGYNLPHPLNENEGMTPERALIVAHRMIATAWHILKDKA